MPAVDREREPACAAAADRKVHTDTQHKAAVAVGVGAPVVGVQTASLAQACLVRFVRWRH